MLFTSTEFLYLSCSYAKGKYRSLPSTAIILVKSNFQGAVMKHGSSQDKATAFHTQGYHDMRLKLFTA